MSDDRDLKFEQYKMLIESADKISDRRNHTNTFFLTINTTLLAAMPFLSDKASGIQDELFVVLIICLLGALLNLVWFLNIRSYKKLNSAKFKIAHKIEEELPHRVFTEEWELLRGKKGFLRYRTLTDIEGYLPLVIILPYLIAYLYYFFYRLG